MGKDVFHFCRLGGGGGGGFLIFFSVGEWKIKNRNRFHLEAAQDEKKWVKKIETAV